MPARALRSTAFAAAMFLVLGAVAWATGRAFLFPSLGPTVYLFAVAPAASAPKSRHVVLGHLIGVLAGLAAYHAIAGVAHVSAFGDPLTWEGARLAASALVSIVLTVFGMEVTGQRHSPACATTLIVALGVLSSPLDGIVIMAAVVLVVAVWLLLQRLGARGPPFSRIPWSMEA